LAAKKKAEEERISKLSAAEQKKVGGHVSLFKSRSSINDNPSQALDRDRKRATRKQQSKSARK
jgi:hypothetical protein